jgi:hypothetical protein
MINFTFFGSPTILITSSTATPQAEPPTELSAMGWKACISNLPNGPSFQSYGAASKDWQLKADRQHPTSVKEHRSDRLLQRILSPLCSRPDENPKTFRCAPIFPQKRVKC